MNIGQFKKTKDGDFQGTIPVLFGNQPVTLEAVKAEGKKPNFIAHLDGSEIGAGWNKTSGKGGAYVSVSLDIPQLPAVVYGALVENKGGEGFSLLWDRPEAK